MATNGKPIAEASKLPLCFVVGPIGKDGSPERKHADLLLNAVIKHVLESKDFSYKVKRADEDADPGMIGDRVVTDIINASLVVADLTDLNPNAFYELGIRHSTERPTIHIARSNTPLPFDNIAHRTIFVDLGDWNSIEQARSQLSQAARSITDPEYKVSNPITQANASFKMRQSDDPRDRFIAEMQEKLSMLEKAVLDHSENKIITPNGLDLSRGERKAIADKIESWGRVLWKEGKGPPEIALALTEKVRQAHPSIRMNPFFVFSDGTLIMSFSDAPGTGYRGILDPKLLPAGS